MLQRRPTPLCLINVVGLTSRLLSWAPCMRRIAAEGIVAPLEPVVPAVTCSAQATLLTGVVPQEHGVVGNGWYWRELGEVRFWVQSNRLLEAPPLYVTARRLATQERWPFTCAKLFWWFNQGAPVDWSVTPKPYYGADGSKIFAIHGYPQDLPAWLEQRLGRFPFPSFWGPKAGLPSSQWIAEATCLVLKRYQPTLTLVYLPHLDYDLQRFGPTEVVLARCVAEVDRCVERIYETAQQVGMPVALVSEYGLVAVRRPVFLNRILREAGWLVVRDGPFGETLETFQSKAFGVVDHQVAHVYVSDPSLVPAVAERLGHVPGVERVVQDREELVALGLSHRRSGDLVLLAEPDAWFVYYYWLEDRRAPDFARTVDIHRKPGYDPCELFFDPALRWPMLKVLAHLVRGAVGFRSLLKVVPLDPYLVQGSHGLPPACPEDAPVYIGPLPDGHPVPRRMPEVHDLVLRLLGLPWEGRPAEPPSAPQPSSRSL
jgi:predicted AlkP superfamily pyrophosphatase or phosphodiesterase